MLFDVYDVLAKCRIKDYYKLFRIYDHFLIERSSPLLSIFSFPDVGLES